jgi:hypothetical protein
VAPGGFSSTFKYCVEVLHLSEDAAFNRIEAARLARKHPVVIDMLVFRGRWCVRCPRSAT